jgi:hypothetical protein
MPKMVWLLVHALDDEKRSLVSNLQQGNLIALFTFARPFTALPGTGAVPTRRLLSITSDFLRSTLIADWTISVNVLNVGVTRHPPWNAFPVGSFVIFRIVLSPGASKNPGAAMLYNAL